MEKVLLAVDSRPGHPKSRHTQISETAITIDGERFGWTDIDRISYSAVVFLAMGFDQDARFTLAVGAGARQARFQTSSKGSGILRNDRLRAIREEQQNAYAVATALVEDNVGERLVTETVRALHRGDSVEIAGLRLDRHGMSKKGLFGEKSARWSAIYALNVFEGALQIWADGNRKKPALTTAQAAWNAVLLPKIIEKMGGPAASG